MRRLSHCTVLVLVLDFLTQLLFPLAIFAKRFSEDVSGFRNPDRFHIVRAENRKQNDTQQLVAILYSFFLLLTLHEILLADRIIIWLSYNGT